MKLKEKLAIQYLGSLVCEGGLSKREVNIYLTGFEKAREMIAKDIYGRHPSIGGLCIFDVGEEEVDSDLANR